MEPNLVRVIDQIAKDKGIDRKILIEAIESAMLEAAKRKFGEEMEIEAQFNEEIGEVELFHFKKVVDVVNDAKCEVNLDEAREYDEEAQLNDTLGMKIDSKEFGRIAAQTAKYVIIQKIQDAERDIYYKEYIERKGEVITGIVRRFEKRDIIVDLGKTEAILFENDQIPRERYRVGDRVQALIKDVLRNVRGPQIILSRTDKKFLIKLFEMEVPEINEGIVKIRNAAREPGERAKIAVLSEDSQVDPVGACVGMKGSRVQNIVHELKGERIDIVPWNPDPAKFVCSAVAPAEVSKVIIDEQSKLMELIVPDDHLSLAIGKKGQNVKLAAQLTMWKIDISSESEANAQSKKTKTILEQIEGVDESLANLIIKQGFSSLTAVLKADDKNLSDLFGISKESVQKLKDGIKQKLESIEKEGDVQISKEEEVEFGIHTEEEDFGQEV